MKVSDRLKRSVIPNAVERGDVVRGVDDHPYFRIRFHRQLHVERSIQNTKGQNCRIFGDGTVRNAGHDDVAGRKQRLRDGANRGHREDEQSGDPKNHLTAALHDSPVYKEGGLLLEDYCGLRMG